MAFNNWYMTVCFKGKINAQDFMRLCPCLNQHLECLCWSENNLVTSICRCHIFLLPMIAAFVILPFAFPLFNPFCQRSSKPLQTLLSLQTIIMLGKKKNLKRSDSLGPQNRRPSWGKSKILEHQTLKLLKSYLFITSTLTFLPNQACSNTYSPYLTHCLSTQRKKIHATWSECLSFAYFTKHLPQLFSGSHCYPGLLGSLKNV